MPALWRPRSPVFWVLAVAVAVCAPLQLMSLGAALVTPSALAAGTGLVAVQLCVLWAVSSTPLGGRHRPLSLRLTAVAWGAIVVPVIAVFANTRHLAALNVLGLHSIAASIAAPLDEDLLRLIGTIGVLTLLSRTSLTVRDGMLCGFLVGTGFEIVENLVVVLGAASPADALQAALARTGVGFGLHALWTAITGAALASCLVRRRAGRRPRWFVLAAGLGVPMLLHALWDAPGLSAAPVAVTTALLAVYLTTLALFAACIRWARLSPPAPRRIRPR